MSHATIVGSNEHNQQKNTRATLAAAAWKLVRENDRGKHMMRRRRRGDPKGIAQWFELVWMDFRLYLKPKIEVSLIEPLKIYLLCTLLILLKFLNHVFFNF